MTLFAWLIVAILGIWCLSLVVCVCCEVSQMVRNAWFPQDRR